MCYSPWGCKVRHDRDWTELIVKQIPWYFPINFSHYWPCFCSVAQLCPTLCDPWTAAACQAILFFTISQRLLKLMSIESVMPSNHLILLHPLLLLPSIFPSRQGLFQWTGPSHQVAKVLELKLQHRSFQWIFRVDFLKDWLVGSPCCPRDSQESSPVPQYRSINSLVLSLLNGPTLISVHDYWKKHNWLYVSCWQNDVSAFLYAV